MPPLAWLVVAVVAAVTAYLVGWPAYQGARLRDSRDTNTERYLAWRGRAPRGQPLREGPTADERRRMMIGVALAALAAVALIAFFVAS